MNEGATYLAAEELFRRLCEEHKVLSCELDTLERTVNAKQERYNTIVSTIEAMKKLWPQVDEP